MPNYKALQDGTENQDDMVTKTPLNSWLRTNYQSVCAWKGFKAAKRKRLCEVLKSQEEEKGTFPDGKHTRERTNKHYLWQ